MNLACFQMAEPQAKTCNTPHLVDVHNLLDDPLKIKALKYGKLNLNVLYFNIYSVQAETEENSNPHHTD